MSFLLKKMNARLALLVVSLALVGLLLVACGDNTPTATPPAATTATATTAAPTTSAPAATTANATVAAPTTAAPVSPIATATALPTTAAATTAAPTTTSANTPTTSPAQPATTVAATTAAPTTPASTTAPGTTAASGAAPAVSGTPADVNKNLFLDDRSNAVQVIRSFYNAINRKEYVRAYSYYSANNANFPAYLQFEQGYKDTATVEVFVGPVTSGVGAGNIYYGVPFSLKSTSAAGAVQVFAGCYTVHGATDPRVFGAPPFIPLNIDSAKVQPVPAGGNTANIMASSCEATGNPPMTITPVPADDSAVAANYFLDDRSTPQALIRSFYNAINRKEYVRAYSYFVTQGATTPPPAYAQFAEGYKNTDSVQLTTGKPDSDAGAGNISYTVPVKLTVKNADGSTQSFSGNYILHKAQPANFGAPPFVPLGIFGADIK
jgi:hypothetical protein